jgi:exonuclease III
MAARARRSIGKALRIAFWNANGVRGRKIELDYFIAQHGVDVCLLNEIHLDPGQAFRFANYICHRTDRSTKGGGTAILVRRGIEHHALPVAGLRHLEATAIELKLAGKPTKIPAVYVSLYRPLIMSDLTACLSGGLPVLMEGDLNAKHVDWISRLTTVRRKLLRDYADRHSCFILGPDSSTTVLL